MERFEDLLLALACVPKGFRTVCADVTASTNKDAKNAARGATSDMLFVAERQTEGRGRLGRSFISEKGGLYMSLLFGKRLRAEDAVRVTVYAAVCVSRVIERLTGIDVGIKWVNDIFVGGKKLAGILCEGVCDETGAVTHTVLGIGVNLRGELAPDIRDIATVLSDHTDRAPDTHELALRITEEIYSSRDEAFDAILAEYRRRSLVIGKRVKVVRVGREEYLATATDIDEDGALVLRLDTGETEHLATGEVSVRLS